MNPDVIQLGHMPNFHLQCELIFGKPVVAGACFITPGSSPYGETRLPAMAKRVANLVRDDSSIPASFNEGIGEYEGPVFVAATDAEIGIFSVTQSLTTVSIGNALVRCNRSADFGMSFAGSNTKVVIAFGDRDPIHLTTQDSPENVKNLLSLFQ